MHIWVGFWLVLIGLLNPVKPVLALDYTFTPIDVPFQGDPGARVNDINDSGQMVGGTPRGQAFLVSEGQVSSIDLPFPGARQTEARSINNSGQIVGDFVPDREQRFQSFLKSGTSFSTINLPIPGARVEVVTRINNNGQILGIYSDVENKSHGFLSDGRMLVTIEHPFPNDPNALGDFFLSGVNDTEQVVGTYTLRGPQGGPGGRISRLSPSGRHL